ncbi:hypothetical protein BSU04_25830 [Caballeronia sordidicola]|uniref:Uncharacterized protein n=1 Tax=Caballeronia sordidicola TaxID=196367 RepID=A0A226WX05_CABSO|nr:hypothetical protein BSU04_25830 [Caballeronia sordidicola]
MPLGLFFRPGALLQTLYKKTGVFASPIEARSFNATFDPCETPLHLETAAPGELRCRQCLLRTLRCESSLPKTTAYSRTVSFDHSANRAMPWTMCGTAWTRTTRFRSKLSTF